MRLYRYVGYRLSCRLSIKCECGIMKGARWCGQRVSDTGKKINKKNQKNG